METKYVRVPFDVELAKKITEKSVEGRIVTRHGLSVRIICWDIKDEKFPLGALVCSNHKEAFISYTIQGDYYSNKMVEHNYDLMLEIPEYMTFKEGDVIAYDDYKTISITVADINSKDKYETAHYYAELRDGELHFYDEGTKDILSIGARLATVVERQKLIDALNSSNEPKAKEYLKRFFPEHSNSLNIGKNCEFKPSDKVLVRDNGGNWICSLFSHISKKQDKYKYITVTGSFQNCIPYNEQTAHLLGTTENYE